MKIRMIRTGWIAGKRYTEGQIVENPTPLLISMAEREDRMGGQQICEFVGKVSREEVCEATEVRERKLEEHRRDELYVMAKRQGLDVPKKISKKELVTILGG